jgi:hypothetical protein
MIPKDFWEDAAMYIVTLCSGCIVDGNKTGYNWKATNINKKAIVNDEKTRASQYFFLETNLDTFATAKNDNKGKMKNADVYLKLSVIPRIKIRIYKNVVERLTIKKIIPFFF